MNKNVMPKILVMGGTKFVSRCIATILINKGYVVDIMTRGQQIIDYSGYNEHLVCDRHDQERLKTVLKNKKYEFIFDINAYCGNDVKMLLQALDTTYMNKYILCSTGSVYTFEEGIVDEISKRLNIEDDNSYGVNKKIAEDILIESGIPYAIIRPTYIYGEYNDIPRESYIFKAIETGRPLEICKDKSTKINLIYVEDLAKIFISCIETVNAFGCYNGCNEEIVSFEEYIKICEEIVGKEANIIYYQLPDKEPNNISFPYSEYTLLMSNKKLAKNGLYVPKTKLKDGLFRTYEWLKK